MPGVGVALSAQGDRRRTPCQLGARQLALGRVGYAVASCRYFRATERWSKREVLRLGMYIIALLAIAILLFVFMQGPRRRPGEPFDWTHRRRWWRPRAMFPDDR